jgi:hypothetical protein
MHSIRAMMFPLALLASAASAQTVAPGHPDDRQREDCRRIAGGPRVTPLAHREILSALNINLLRASIVDRSVLVSYIAHVDRVVYVLRKLFI